MRESTLYIYIYRERETEVECGSTMPTRDEMEFLLVGLDKQSQFRSSATHVSVPRDALASSPWFHPLAGGFLIFDSVSFWRTRNLLDLLFLPHFIFDRSYRIAFLAIDSPDPSFFSCLSFPAAASCVILYH